MLINRRKTLLEVPRQGDPRSSKPNEPTTARGSRKWVKWLASCHALLIPAIGFGWAYSALLWPTWLLPTGVAISSPRRVEGLLKVGSDGQKARFIAADRLRRDWYDWIATDSKPELTSCIALPLPIEQRLASTIAANAHASRPAQFWVTADLETRFGPAQCGSDEALHHLDGLKQIDTITPVPCSRAVFVANGFSCPDRGAPLDRSSQLSAEDYYPASALRANEEGKVTVRVDRDITGSPTHCVILQSSGHGALDRQACKLVGLDPGFTPHQHETTLGQPIIQSVVWRIPD